MSDATRRLWKAGDISQREKSFSHPWNPKSEVVGTHLSPLAGLQRTGVSIVRIPPGRESFCYHNHYCEEEWLYVLSGRAVARIDGEEFEVGAGDFMGFSTPSVAHHLINRFQADFVYLMGGENRDIEVADFPDLGKRMLRLGDHVEIHDMDNARPFGEIGGNSD